jgi:hypothetical protein
MNIKFTDVSEERTALISTDGSSMFFWNVGELLPLLATFRSGETFLSVYQTARRYTPRDNHDGGGNGLCKSDEFLYGYTGLTASVV